MSPIIYSPGKDRHICEDILPGESPEARRGAVVNSTSAAENYLFINMPDEAVSVLIKSELHMPFDLAKALVQAAMGLRKFVIEFETVFEMGTKGAKTYQNFRESSRK